ncbi:hypothetical protein [Williamsia sp.]|uniref:hypothetical protein n=1 Tax=Williamsia sp. TaxID=1872085 RepID=UPI002F95A281
MANATVGTKGLRDRREARPLAQLVTAAADALPDRPAVVGSDFAVTFAELRARAHGAATAMTGSPRIDDSALTVAVMTTVPRLAASGPSALAEAFAAIRFRALVVLSEA